MLTVMGMEASVDLLGGVWGYWGSGGTQCRERMSECREGRGQYELVSTGMPGWGEHLELAKVTEEGLDM